MQQILPTWKWRTVCSIMRTSMKPTTTMKGTTGKSVVIPYSVFTSSKTLEFNDTKKYSFIWKPAGRSVPRLGRGRESRRRWKLRRRSRTILKSKFSTWVLSDYDIWYWRLVWYLVLAIGLICIWYLVLARLVCFMQQGRGFQCGSLPLLNFEKGDKTCFLRRGRCCSSTLRQKQEGGLQRWL